MTVRMDLRLLLDKPVSIYGNVVWNITLSSDSFKYELRNFSLLGLMDVTSSDVTPSDVIS